SLSGNGKLGLLCFRSSPNKASTFIPLVVSNISAVAVSGEAPGWVHGNAGRVVLIKDTPLIEAVPGESGNRVFVYGPPSIRVTVQWAPNLTPQAPWSPLWIGYVSNLVQVLSLPSQGTNWFYRAITP